MGVIYHLMDAAGKTPQTLSLLDTTGLTDVYRPVEIFGTACTLDMLKFHPGGNGSFVKPLKS